MGGSKLLFLSLASEKQVIGLEVLQGSSLRSDMMFWNCRIPGKRRRL